MAREKTRVEKAAGKLISSIQKEWEKELGEEYAALTENVLSTAHSFLQARTAENIREVIGDRSVKEFLGKDWVNDHQAVVPSINELTIAIRQESDNGT